MLDLPSNWHPIFMYFSVVFICLLGILQIATWLTSSPQKKDELIFLKEKLILITTLALISTIYSGWSLLTDNPLSHSLQERVNTYKYWIILTVVVFLSAVILFLITKEFRENAVGLLLVFSSVLVIITTIKGSGIYYRYGQGVMPLPKDQFSSQLYKSDMSTKTHSLDKESDEARASISQWTWPPQQKH